MSRLIEVESIFQANRYFRDYDFIVLNLSALFFRREAFPSQFKQRITTILARSAAVTNVLVPGFTFFKRTEPFFSVHETSPTLGWFNSLLFNLFNGKKLLCHRTNSCTHSFFVLGKDAYVISQGTIPEAAFGEESVFDYLESNNGLWINIGCEPNQGYSLIHRVEQLMNIPYRESITFPVIFKDACLNTREIDYQFFARKSDFDSRECFDRLFNCSIFRNSNMSDSAHEYLTIHKYTELTHYICNTMRDNSFAFVMHAQS